MIGGDDFILSKKNFSKLVEEEVAKSASMTYIDAVLLICSKRDIDPADAKSLLTDIIKNKIEVEAALENKINVSYNSLPL